MRTKSLLVAVCIAALPGGVLAADAHHPAGAAKPAAGGMNMGSMGETMKRMHEQMKEIQAATDPKERQRLVEEHMKAMQEAIPMVAGMKDMRGGMQGCGMMQRQD